MSGIQGTKSRPKEKDVTSAVGSPAPPPASPTEVPTEAGRPPPRKASLPKPASKPPAAEPVAPTETSSALPKAHGKKDSSDLKKRPSGTAEEPTASKPTKKKKPAVDERSPEEREAELKELAELLPEAKIDEGVFLVDYIVAQRKNKKGKLEYLIKWKGYSDAQNTWEPAGNILTPQLLEEFEKRKLTHPSAVGDVAPSSKSSKTKSGPIAEPDATTPLKKSKLNKQAQKAPSMGAGELKPVCDTFAKEPTSAPSESPSVSFSKQSELPPDSTMVSTLVDGIQFIESDSVPTPALKKPKAKPQHKKEFIVPPEILTAPTKARASALTAKLLMSENLQRDDVGEADLTSKKASSSSFSSSFSAATSPTPQKKKSASIPNNETWSSSHAHILLAPQPLQDSSQHIPLSSSATAAAIARRDISILIEKNADLLRRGLFLIPSDTEVAGSGGGGEGARVDGKPHSIEDAVKQSQSNADGDSKAFILENNGKFSFDEWAQLSKVLMELGFATISDQNSKMILVTKPVLQNFQYYKEQLLNCAQKPSLGSTSTSTLLSSGATSPSASASDLLAGSLINLAALQQRVPENK